MTRRIVYGICLWATLAATALTIASIVEPRWLSWSSAGSIKYSYGLHHKCSSITGECDEFPGYEDCADDRSFCSMWRTVGFLMSFAVIVELATLIAYVVVILGGKQKRDVGWKIILSLLALAAVVQLVGMSMVAYLFDHDDRFFVGWRLDSSWIMCTVSWGVEVLTAGGLVAAAFCLAEEGGYELIPDDRFG